LGLDQLARDLFLHRGDQREAPTRTLARDRRHRGRSGPREQLRRKPWAAVANEAVVAHGQMNVIAPPARASRVRIEVRHARIRSVHARRWPAVRRHRERNADASRLGLHRAHRAPCFVEVEQLARDRRVRRNEVDVQAVVVRSTAERLSMLPAFLARRFHDRVATLVLTFIALACLSSQGPLLQLPS
jgi:hypothetical protein